MKLIFKNIFCSSDLECKALNSLINPTAVPSSPIPLSLTMTSNFHQKPKITGSSQWLTTVCVLCVFRAFRTT